MRQQLLVHISVTCNDSYCQHSMHQAQVRVYTEIKPLLSSIVENSSKQKRNKKFREMIQHSTELKVLNVNNLYASYKFTNTCVNANFFALIKIHRDSNNRASFNSCRLGSSLYGITFEARVGFGNFYLNEHRRINT